MFTLNMSDAHVLLPILVVQLAILLAQHRTGFTMNPRASYA